MDEGIIRIFHDQKIKPQTKIIGKKIHEYELVDSVMDIAHEKAKKDKEEGTIILAKGQRKGRGRLGRRWLSLYGKGLYFAIILRPDIKHCDAPKITLLSALSVAEALNMAFNINAHIRWPNDVLINDKKICGILTESDTQKGKLNYLVVGMGVNISFKLKELSKEATSLERELKTNIDTNKLLFKILKRFEENYLVFLKKDFTSLIPKIEALSFSLGKRVKIITPKYTIIGLVQDIDEDGAIIIRRDNGFIEKVLTGDCVLLR